MSEPSLSFRLYNRPVGHARSITTLAIEASRAEEEARQRASRSIHGSGFWQCEGAFLMDVRGVKPSNYTFNHKNIMAARSGDAAHIAVQKELRHLAVMVPVYNERVGEGEEWLHDLQDKAREGGWLVPGIEINYSTYFRPLTPAAKVQYAKMGLYIWEDDYYSQLVEYYKLGIRLDMLLRLPWYNRDMPCEIKSTKSKKFAEIQRYVDKLELFNAGSGPEPTPPDKVLDYIAQNQMQMHWWRDTVTGERPEWGVIYIVNRDEPGERIELFVQYNPEFCEYWLPKIRQKAEKWENGGEPEYEPTPGGCGWCAFHSVCPSPFKHPHIPTMLAAKARKKATLLVAPPADDDIPLE